MNLVFLKSPIPITKAYAKEKDGSITKSAYPNIYEVTSIEEPCASLQVFEGLLKKHAQLGHCLLKGNISRPLTAESRAGTTDTNAATEWICLDLDGIPGVSTINDFLDAVGLGDVSYVVQYSASYKIESPDLRAHIFMQLDKPWTAPMLKQWLIDLNMKNDILRNAMSLTKTDNAISWPLDISVCQNDKLIYIAPPKLKGIKDPFAKDSRIKYVKRAKNVLAIPGPITNQSANRELTAKRINELREAKGLPKKKITFKTDGATEYMAKPDSSLVTGTKIDRGFVYFNLNGGDSWGYYHPEDNPKYIYNFKGEPTYLTEELLPDYWAEVQGQAAAAPTRFNTEGITHLVFCDRKTSTYWKGTYDTPNNFLDIHVARTKAIADDYRKANNIYFTEHIVEWDIVFDPSDPIRVDPANRVVNLFQPTPYMLPKDKQKKVTEIPKFISKVITSALGGDKDVIDHFINWLAFIVQNRTITGTAWILHGTEGTGKGLLFHQILAPLFGEHAVMRPMEQLNKNFNGFIEHKLIIVVDEIETKSLANKEGVMATLRNLITEPTIVVEEKHQSSRGINNFANWIFYSNKAEPVAIPRGDRRFNVGKYQPTKLAISRQELGSIQRELQSFYNYLVDYKVDQQAVKTPIETEDRSQMINISESSIDSVGSAVLEGNFGFFIDQLPTNNTYTSNALEFNKVENYKEVLSALLSRAKSSGECNIGRDELRIMFDYTVGNIPTTPNKFTSLLKHHRIHTTKVWINDKAAYGVRTVWKDVKEFSKYQKVFTPAEPGKPKLKAVK